MSVHIHKHNCKKKHFENFTFSQINLREIPRFNSIDSLLLIVSYHLKMDFKEKII